MCRSYGALIFRRWVFYKHDAPPELKTGFLLVFGVKMASAGYFVAPADDLTFPIDRAAYNCRVFSRQEPSRIRNSISAAI